MRIERLWPCVSLLLVACPPVPVAGNCANETCTAEQRCDEATLRCVPDEPPVLAVEAPSQVITQSTFVVTGEVADDGDAAVAEWRLGDSGPFAPITLAADGTFSVTIDTPRLDGANVVLHVRARDARSEVSVSKPLTIDAVAPSLEVTAPLANSVQTGRLCDAAVTTSAGTIEVLVLSAGLQGRMEGGPTSWTFPGITIEQGDGITSSLRFIARDAAGNTTTVDQPIRIDSVAPTLEVTAPLAGSLQTGASLDGAATTSSGTVEVLVSIGSQMATMQGGPTSWTLAGLPLESLDGVDASVRFVARDAAGNTTAIDRPIRIDNVAPRVTITSPAAGSIHRGPVALSATTDTPAASVTLSFDGGTAPLTGGPLAWSASTPTIQQDYAPVTLRVTAQDAVGNAAFSEVTIFVDTVAPVITFTAPSELQRFNASSLSANPNVTTVWTISDSDPQAATTTVNGAASTALSVAVPTSPTDNPAQYITTVVAVDRAGNTATASRVYWVDRVIPTITSFLPAANTRMLGAPVEVTFSEPVFGATSSTPGLSTPTGLPAGAWGPAHDRFSLPLTSWAGRVVQVSLEPNLADPYGNPVGAVAPRLYHVATVIPSGTLLASNVSTFAAASDGDGQLRVNYVTTGGLWRFLTDDLGVLNDSQPAVVPATRVSVNAWNTVNPSTLASTPTWGGSIYNALAPLNDRHRHLFNNGFLFAATHLPGTVVSVPPLNREGATEAYGLVVGNMYTRGTFTRSFTSYADMVTAQSGDSWAIVSYSGSQVRWTRYRCNRDVQLFPGPATYTCDGTEYGGALGSLAIDFLEAVMTRSGNCLLVNVSAPNGTLRSHGGWAQRLENCDGGLGVNPPASCTSNTALPTSSGALNGQKFAPFSANGEDTILVAFPAGTGNPSEYRLEKMLPGTCGFLTTQTPPFSVANVREYQPVQIGNRPAFIYVNTNNELRVHVP